MHQFDTQNTGLDTPDVEPHRGYNPLEFHSYLYEGYRADPLTNQTAASSGFGPGSFVSTPPGSSSWGNLVDGDGETDGDPNSPQGQDLIHLDEFRIDLSSLNPLDVAALISSNSARQHGRYLLVTLPWSGSGYELPQTYAYREIIGVSGFAGQPVWVPTSEYELVRLFPASMSDKEVLGHLQAFDEGDRLNGISAAFTVIVYMVPFMESLDKAQQGDTEGAAVSAGWELGFAIIPFGAGKFLGAAKRIFTSADDGWQALSALAKSRGQLGLVAPKGKVLHSLDDEIADFNRYWDDAIESISDPLVKKRVLEEIADELATGNANARRLAEAIRKGEVNVEFIDDLPLTVRGGYDELTKTIQLRSTDIDDIAKLASVFVHEGRHWLDDMAGMLARIRRNLGSGNASKIPIELRAHLQQLIYDLEKGMSTTIANKYKLGGWEAVVRHVWEIYSK